MSASSLSSIPADGVSFWVPESTRRQKLSPCSVRHEDSNQPSNMKHDRYVNLRVNCVNI